MFASPLSSLRVSAGMTRVYNYMFLGLILTAVVSLFTASSPALMAAIFGTPLKWVVLLAPIGFVLAMSFGYNKFSANTLRTLFFTYAFINGLSLSILCVAYTGASLFGAFLSASAVFAVMSVIGYTTKTDLTKYGPILFAGLIALLIVMVVNIFVGSSALNTAISCLGVLLFTALTAYDTQKIAEQVRDNSDGKAGIMGALTLYLDFLNLFLFILNLLGVKTPQAD